MYICANLYTTAAPKILSGRSLARSQAGACQLAAIGAQFFLRETELQWTMTGAAEAAGTTLAYVSAACRLSAEHRAYLAEGGYMPRALSPANHRRSGDDAPAMPGVTDTAGDVAASALFTAYSGAMATAARAWAPLAPASALGTSALVPEITDADLRRIASIVGAPAMMRAAIEAELETRGAVEAVAAATDPATT